MDLTREEALAEIARLKRKLREREARRLARRARGQAKDRVPGVNSGGVEESRKAPQNGTEPTPKNDAWESGNSLELNFVPASQMLPPPGRRGSSTRAREKQARGARLEDANRDLMGQGQARDRVPDVNFGGEEETKQGSQNGTAQTPKNDVLKSGNLLELDFVPASQLLPPPGKKGSSRAWKKKSGLSRSARSSPGDPLSGLRVGDANALGDPEGAAPAGWRFRMPQPNADRILTAEEFSLPRDYTGSVGILTF